MSRITNKFAVGEYAVTLKAHKNTVAHFSVASVEDAEFEAQRLAHVRKLDGKSTEQATARLITERRIIKRQCYHKFGPEIDLQLSKIEQSV